MPFTISHAGFVVPLRGAVRPSIMAALMIGSMVPDVPYFFRAFDLAAFSHSIAGAFGFSLPVALLVFYLAKAIWTKGAAILPEPHAGLIASWSPVSVSRKKEAGAVSMAILAGALSHSFADSFTHASGVAVAMFPALSKTAFTIMGEDFPVYRVLQYTGSVIGLLLLLAGYGFALHSHCVREKMRFWQEPDKWRLLVVFAVVTTLLAAGVNFHLIAGRADLLALRSFGFRFLITWMPLAAVGFLGLAIFSSKKRADLHD